MHGAALGGNGRGGAPHTIASAFVVAQNGAWPGTRCIVIQDMLARAITFTLLAAVLQATAAEAQTRVLVARADSLLAIGEVARADTLYFVASRRDVRDPGARVALGKYLGSRGAFRVGATLIEESIPFGGDTVTAARARAPLLQAANDWPTLAQLARSPLSPAEQVRAEWLAAHPPAVKGADSVTITFEHSSVAGLGRVRIIVGNDTLAADIDPNSDELVLGDYRHYAAFVRVFSAPGGNRVAVADRVVLGDIILERVPARIDSALGPARARMGLAQLARFAPTVDAGAGVITLRRDGKVSAELRGRRVPVMFSFPGVRIARPGRLVPIESPAGRAVLAEARWTLDFRRGELVLEVDR
jgi:hypothetical protein